MQRYNATSCTNPVSSTPVSAGLPHRDTTRTDSPSLQNFPLSSRRTSQLAIYKLRCDREQLNSRLGPPDFHPQTPNCPEETLPKENVQSGYKETVEGIEEAREISLTQVQTFSKTVVVKCREAIRKRLRAINESRAQKRKAGQVYGIPLSGSLLTKAGAFPEQKPCTEDFRKKWIEALSQPHKRLCALADHVPHGYRRKFLFEVLIRNNVPLLRATWFIKITYLNQIRPGPASISSASGDKTQIARTELWTKDVIDYLQYLLDEFLTRSNSHSVSHKDQSPQMMYSASQMYKIESATSVISDGTEPSFHFKWWYVIRIIQWHNSEKLLLPSYIIDWVLSQLQDKESLEIFQLMLPIINDLIESIIMSQSYVRTLVVVATRFIQTPSPPRTSDHLDNSQKAHLTSTITELLRYLIVAVPDTFVSFDCLPALSSIASTPMNDDLLSLKLPWRIKNDYLGSSLPRETTHVSSSLNSIVSSIQKHSNTLTNAVTPGYPGHNMAMVIRSLDEALLWGDVTGAYHLLFEHPFEGIVTENWVKEISAPLKLSLKCIGTVPSSFICSIFFLCEWAASDIRNCRTYPHHQKLTGGRDYLQIYISIRILRLILKALDSLTCEKNNLSSRTDIFQNPGPLHEIVVCWIDQHNVEHREGFKLLQLLIMEMTRSGIFLPHAYVRQLIVSGVADMDESPAAVERQKRHCQILKYLPMPYVRTALEEAKIFKDQSFTDSMRVYAAERRLILRNMATRHFKTPTTPSFLRPCKTSKKEDVKSTIALFLQLPSPSPQTDPDECQGCVTISSGKTDIFEGCEECRKVVKRQKISDEKSARIQGNSSDPSDDEDTWWMKKIPEKPLESLKEDPPVKMGKHMPKGRQKVIRKTQSLAQLATTRMESSHGASASHVCGSNMVCNQHHHSTAEREGSKTAEMCRGGCYGDLVLIGRSLRRMCFIEKRSITGWLTTSIRSLLEDPRKPVSKIMFSPSDESSLRWKLGEDELLVVLYLMDVCDDDVSAVRFLLWLLPKVLNDSGPTIHGGRMAVLPRTTNEGHVCDVGEAFLLSSLRRYENVLVATDLIPDLLSISIHRAMAAMISGGRVINTPSLVYAKQLLRKYSTVPSIIEWEAKFKSTCDKRFLSEFESGKFLETDSGFSVGTAISGMDDPDDFLRQKLATFRLSRVGMGMREVVQRHVEEAFHYFIGKERKLSASGVQKNTPVDKWDHGQQISKQIIMGLTECIRQTGGAAQEGDPALVSSAVSAIVYNVGLAFSKLPDFSASKSSSHTTSSTGWYVARQILRIHVTCLCLLKEVLGERHSRVFEVALASESSSAITAAFSPSRGSSRTPFHVSPDSHDTSGSVTASSEGSTNPSFSKIWIGRPAKIAAAVSALVVGAVIHGVTSLERMITVFRLKEGLDFVHFVRTNRCNSNGNSRSMGPSKTDGPVDVCAHWFRLLIGNSRTVFDGFFVELFGEPAIAALVRMQRTLPVTVALPPAYSLFAFLMWRHFLVANSGFSWSDDLQQVYQSLSAAINDVLKHRPFRDACLKDTQRLYDLMASDTTDSEFAALLEQMGTDIPTRVTSFVPLRARLFLNSIIDCKMPVFKFNHSRREEIGLLDEIVNTLDTLQPSKFHWQWVELRLLLNEQAVREKLENHDTSLLDALRYLLPYSEKAVASENENNFIQIILTRLLVRPDAAPLFAEVIHRFGRSLEDSMLLQAKWFLGGPDVLFGRKSIKQRLVNIAEGKGLSTKPGFWRPWGWSDSDPGFSAERGERKKCDMSMLEEGEVVEEIVESRTYGRPGAQVSGLDVVNTNQPNLTERGLVELILPCVDQSSNDSRLIFAGDLIKQMNNIEQQINGFTRGLAKHVGILSPAADCTPIKTNNRKSIRGGSPGSTRWSPGGTEIILPSPVALRASLNLRLQFIIRLLPIICGEREASGRNMRHTLASVLLRLLVSRTIYEETDPSQMFVARKEAEMSDCHGDSHTDLYGDGLFDRMLFIFHGLLSSFRPVWLKMKPGVKFINESSRDFSNFDREVAEGLRSEMDQMHLPEAIRWRILSAMPWTAPSLRCTISCQPLPSAPPPLQKIPFPLTRAAPVQPAKSKPPTSQPDTDIEVDPWTLLEDGAGSGSSSAQLATGGDPSYLRASHLLRGAVRLRRTDLTYIGTVDDDT